MNTRHTTLWWLLLTMAFIGMTLFTGCRAFQPEAVIVNKPPETFLIGAPIAGGGGYFHYHMFWYGSDVDGRVEKFVWALSDTTIQDDESADDEEDARFNPALDITHLEIGHYTTKTDSVFDFQINQGTTPSVGMTLHMVAIDDFGDFDRTPARLHFFSNTLGTPIIDFFRVEGEDLIPLEYSKPDSVGFGKPYRLKWRGATPNIYGYDEDALALVDTVPPLDGLYGYKWQLGGDLGGNCVSSFEDCWHPRKYNEATGDSFSFFAGVNQMEFKNDNTSDDAFGKLLDSGVVTVRVNSLDVAGVEVNEAARTFQLVVNYDPETIILNGESDPNYDDDTVYPYYTLLDDETHTQYPFVQGQRIPDRTYVVFKAIARDDPRDGRAYPDFQIGLTGTINGLRTNYTGAPFPFSSGASPIDYEPQWAGNEDGWYADTLGFLVAPRTEFTFLMQAVDEHGRRDQTPSEFKFEVGFPPCVQCVELFPNTNNISEVGTDLDCYVAGTPGHECFGTTESFHVLQDGEAPLPGRTYLQPKPSSIFIAINKTGSHSARFVSEEPDETTFWSFRMQAFSMGALLHGKDDDREIWENEPKSRVGGWKYQVDYDCDPGNTISDGGGFDDLAAPTWNEAADGLSISPADGLWAMGVDVYIPQILYTDGMFTFRFMVGIELGEDNTEELVDEIVQICLRQMSHGKITVIALDQSECTLDTQVLRPSMYHVFSSVRPPVLSNPYSGTWRDCDFPSGYSVIKLGLQRHAMDSAEYDPSGDLIPVEKHFNITFQGSDGVDPVDFQCDGTE
jgi:hypothetical protein